MSRETSEWLNQNCLIGFTDQRGHAWHYNASDQGSEPNHYSEAIPVADVLRRLFSWQAIEAPVYVAVPGTIDECDSMDADGNPVRFIRQGDRKAMLRDDTYATLGLFKSGYQGHQYAEWLLGNVANILSDELGIGGAGLLAGGAQAYVQVEVPENVETPEGMTFRPRLLATTSFDGTIATTYKRCVGIVVCDNTREMALGEKGESFKVKHTTHSLMKIEDAKQALGLVSKLADDFAIEVARLAEWSVSDPQWDQLLTSLCPIDDDSKRSVTVGDKKREELNSLYRFDNRCAPWVGTALGVVQTFNTWQAHVRPIRGATMRNERNVSDVISGATGKADAVVLDTLASVCGVLTNA